MRSHDASAWSGPWPPPNDDGTAWPLLEALWESPVATVLVDRQLRARRSNDAFARATGLSAAESAGRLLAELVPGAWPDDLGQRLVARGEAIPGVEVRGEWPAGSGEIRCWRADCHPIRGRAGDVLGAAVMLADVTERERAEGAARDAAADAERSVQALMRLQAVTAALAAAVTPAEVARVVLEEGIGLLDADAGSVSWRLGEGELEILDAFGYPEKAVVAGRRCARDLSAPLAEAYREKRPVWLASREEYAARYPHLGKAALPFPAGACAAVPLVVNDRAIGVLGIDFASPTRFEPPQHGFILALAQQCAQALERARLYEAQEQLRSRAEKTAALLDTLLSSVPIGLAFADRDLCIVHANSAWARVLGTGPEACVGRAIEELLPGEPGEERARAWRRVLESGEPILEIESTRADPLQGSRTWLESWYPIVAGGRTAGVGAVAREVTAAKRAEEFRRHVLGIVGHDLRNPLSAILGHARLLASSSGLDERQSRMLRGIDTSAHRAERIVRDLLDLTRIETARALPVDVRRARVDEICRAAVDEVAAANPDREIGCDGRGNPEVEWDPDRVAQALSNLLVNGIKHGAPDLPVSVEWDAGREEVALHVRNRGPPIPADVAGHLFEAFHQGGQGEVRRAGLGLGLYITREIVCGHGGSIHVRSTEQDGTVFTLRLPRSARARP